jgi:transcriptional regulator with XRE-family HTH domain
MKSRKILAEQIRDRMAKRPGLDTQQALSKAAGVTQSTIWRILEQRVGASVDVVDDIAKALGTTSIALLCEPDQIELFTLFDKLEPGDKEKVLSFMNVTIRSKSSNIELQNHFRDEKLLPKGLASAAISAASQPLEIGDKPHVIKTAATAKKTTARKRHSV